MTISSLFLLDIRAGVICMNSWPCAIISRLYRSKKLKRITLEKQTKINVINEFKTSNNDTGSTDVQIALLTARISQLTSHLVENPKDFTTKRSMLRLVAQRKKLLNYLKNEDGNKYLAIVAKLGIRK